MHYETSLSSWRGIDKNFMLMSDIYPKTCRQLPMSAND